MKERLLSIGSVLTALLASACCTLPVLFMVLGVGGIGVIGLVTPYRTPLTILTFLLLGVAFFLTYRKKGCDGCGPTKGERVNRIVLWVSLVLAVVFLLFPWIDFYLGIRARLSVWLG